MHALSLRSLRSTAPVSITALRSLLLLSAATASAGDGRVEINQARAAAGGITPSDTPGFPIQLEGNQSYVLTSDLDASSFVGFSVSGLGSDNITIDFNGFSLRGNGSGISSGINSTGENVEVKNGTIIGFAGRGLLLQTQGRHVVRNMRVIENGSNGIDSNGSAIITDCHVLSNGGDGISVSSRGYVARNRVSNSAGIGIKVGISSLVENNLITHGSTTEAALDLGTFGGGYSSGYHHNVINNPNTGGTVVGGVDMGDNLCNGSTSCP